jgi:Ran GTPase-activating protein (RanGAP) involved in mRNA processing and transport
MGKIKKVSLVGQKPLGCKNPRNSYLVTEDLYIDAQFGNVIDRAKLGQCEIIDLNGANLCDKGLEIMIPILKGNANLKSLKLGKNSLTDRGLKLLLKGLERLKGLNCLVVGNNFLTEESLGYLGEFIGKCKS